MTRSGVGRSWRTASRRAYAPPAGGWSSRLPSIQAAAQRATVRADRVALRLGLRTLVVAGFAGAAWLLCANAAQAADAPATDRTTDLSAVHLVRSVGPGDAVAGVAPDADLTGSSTASTALLSPVTEVLTPARQPVLGSAAARLVGDPTSAPSPAPIAEPARPAGATGRSPVAGSQSRHPLGSVRGLIASLGAAGRAAGSTPAPNPTANPPAQSAGPLTGVTTGATAALDAIPRGLGGWLRTATAPVHAASAALASPVTSVGPRSAVAALWSPARHSTRVTDRDDTRNTTRDAVRATARLGACGDPAGTDGRVVTATRANRAVTAAGKFSTSGSATRRAGAAASAEGRTAITGTGEVPVQPLPAPSRGWVAGGSAGGSGVLSEGGANAVVSTVVAAGCAAVRRPPVAAEVEVSRLDAEAPTVSPD